MKLRQAILTGLITGSLFTFSGCSKESNGVSPAPAANMFLQGADGPPLWFVDNIEVVNPYKKGGLKISPNEIQSVTLLSPASTTDLVSRYGSKGKNGVVLVVTKKADKQAQPVD